MSSELNLNTINFQNAIRSKPVRENFTDIQNNYNLLRNEVYASLASTASEVVSARGGFGALVDNINIRSVGKTGVKSASSNNVDTLGVSGIIRIYAGEGICPDGSGVKWSNTTLDAVTQVSKKRYGVAVVNNDSSVAVEWGATATRPLLPPIAKSQRPLATILQNTGVVTLSNQFDIVDAREQGCHIGTAWEFKISDAFSLHGVNGASISVGKGRYVEDLTYPDNTDIYFHPLANLYNTVGVLQTQTPTINRFSVIKGQKANNIIHSDSYTENDIFDALAPSLPNTGDTIIINGSRSRASDGGNLIEHYTFSHATKTSATKITLYGSFVKTDAGTETGGLYSLEIDDGDATNIAGLSIVW